MEFDGFRVSGLLFMKLQADYSGSVLGGPVFFFQKVEGNRHAAGITSMPGMTTQVTKMSVKIS